MASGIWDIDGATGYGARVPGFQGKGYVRMRGSGLVLLMFIAVGCLQPFAAAAQDAGKGGAYASKQQAWDAFNASADPEVRSGAFAWVKQHAEQSTSDIWDIYSMFRKMAQVLKREGEFEAACLERMKTATQDIRNSVAASLSECYVDGEKFEAGAKVITDCLADSAEATPDQLAWLAQRGAAILSSRLSRPKDADKLLADVTEKVRSNTNAVATLMNARSSLLHTALSDAAGAEALSRQVLALGDACGDQQYATAVYQAALIEKEKGKPEDAVNTLMLVLKRKFTPPEGIARRLMDYKAPPAALEEGVRLLRGRMAAPAKDLGELQSRFERIPEIVEMLIALGRNEEAMCEARVLTFVSPDKNYQKVVDAVTRWLKLLDGNLGRANAFLSFQQADAEKAGDRKNPLMDLPALNDPVRAELLKAFESAPPPADWNAWLMRSVHLLWLDRPAEAMDAAAKAFSVSPMSDAALQACAAATARPLLAATRDTAAAQRIVDYLLWGENGPNGKIENPFPEARRRLAYPAPK